MNYRNPIKPKENQSRNSMSAAHAKLCKDMLISLVHKYFGDEPATLKYGGKQKWNHISNTYNELGGGVLERSNAITLNAKWRNIIYRAKLMKEPHPLSKHDNIVDERMLKEKVTELKLHPQNMTSTSKSSTKFQTCNVMKLLNDNEQNYSEVQENNRLKLSDIKREFGIGILKFLLRVGQMYY